MNKNITFDNLYISGGKCSKNVKWKKSTAHYLLNQLEETYKLFIDLKNGTYKERPHKEFKVYEPKERDVLSIAFRDRVYQRTLNDLVIYPKMTKSFIYDNGANQLNKGTDFARDRLKEHLHRYFRENHTNKGFIIHLDIKKYYPTMSHQVAEDLLKKKLPKNVFLLVKDMLKMYKGDVGYCAGSQLIQILGISVLDNLDHYIKEQLKVKHYVRYMDDLVLIVKDNPQYYMDCVSKKLEKLHFKLNETKSKYTTIYKGVDFLGFNFSMNETGKVYKCILKSNLKRRRTKLRKQGEKQTIDELKSSYTTWRNYAITSTSKKGIYACDKIYNDLINKKLEMLKQKS